MWVNKVISFSKGELNMKGKEHGSRVSSQDGSEVSYGCSHNALMNPQHYETRSGTTEDVI